MNTPQNTSFWETRPRDHDHKDWLYESKDWIEGYEKSVDHPHRFDIVQALYSFSFGSLLEIGCSVGPNLKRIWNEFPLAELSGIDPNKDSVERAKDYLPKGIKVTEGDVRAMPFTEVDIILADASLMYIEPNEIKAVMDKLALCAKKGIIIVERYSPSKTGEIVGGVWGRDYETLLKERGFKVDKIKITEESWPHSPNWQKFGFIFVGRRV